MPGIRPILAVLLFLTACANDPASLEPLPPDSMDSRGGTLEFDDGNLRLSIPGGALDRMVTFTVDRLDDDIAELHGPQYQLGPDGVDLSQPMEVRLKFDPTDLIDVAQPEHMFAAIKVGDEWQGVPAATVDIETSEVIVLVSGIGPPETVEVDVPDPNKTILVAYLDDPTGGVDANDISLKIPRYVDAVRGSDVLGGPGNERGTLEQPWKTVTFGLSQTQFSVGGLGQKLVVLTAAEYAYDNGESFPMTLEPHFALLAEDFATLKSGPMQDLFRAPFDNVKTQVEGFSLVCEQDPTVGGHRDRGYIAFVEAGHTVFKNCTSLESWGFLINDGELEIQDCSLRSTAAHVEARGGTLELDGSTLRSAEPRVGGAPIAKDFAALVLDNSFGTPLEVIVDGCTFRSSEVGIWAPNGGDLEVFDTTFRSNSRYGIEIGTAPVGGSPPSTATVDIHIYQTSFRGNEAGMYVNTSGRISGGQGTYQRLPDTNNFENGRDPVWWFGPGPYPSGVDIIYPLAVPVQPSWFEFGFLGSRPPGLFGASMGFDRERGDVVLFGGKQFNGVLNSTTWLFDLDDYTWTTSQPAPPGLAGGRMDAAMGYDATFESANRVPQQLYLFGGHTDFANDTLFNDLWYFDGASEQWNLAHAGGPPSSSQPSARYGATLTRLPAGGYLLLGGFDGTNYLADGWEFDPVMGRWVPVPVGDLTPRAFHSTIVMANPTRILVQGGQTTGGTPVSDLQIAEYGSTNFITVTDQFSFRVGDLEPRTMGALFRADDNSLGRPVFQPFGGFNGSTVLDLGIIFQPTTNADLFTQINVAGAQDGAKVEAAGPSPRQRFPWVVVNHTDRGRRIPVFFGGDPGDGSPFLTDTWAAVLGPAMP